MVYLISWTLALLTTEPVHEGEAILPRWSLFYAAKGLHVSAYFILAIVTGWLHIPLRYRWIFLFFMSAHALGTEFFQQFVPERTSSLRDVALDLCGILLGIMVSWKWWQSKP